MQAFAFLRSRQLKKRIEGKSMSGAPSPKDSPSNRLPDRLDIPIDEERHEAERWSGRRFEG